MRKYEEYLTKMKIRLNEAKCRLPLRVNVYIFQCHIFERLTNLSFSFPSISK